MDAAPDPETTGELTASTDVRAGFLSGPGFRDVPVRYSVVDGRALFQGCIDMGPVDEVEAHTTAVRGALAAAAAAAPPTPASVAAPGGQTAGAQSDGIDVELFGVGLPSSSGDLWPNGVVPFVVDGGLTNPGRVDDAIAHLHANTGIRFVQRTNQSDFVRFRRSTTGSSSRVGRVGGEQAINLLDSAPVGTVVHECLHCLGVLHEQSRCDRDGFVKVNWANIESGKESNFDKACAGFVDYQDYDYGSIMHYGTHGFSTNGQPTLEPLQSGVTIGQRTAMSTGDRLAVAHMYSRFSGSGHTGVWRAGSGGYALWVNTPWDSFVAKWQEWAGQGLRLVDVDVRQVGRELRYSGVWRPGTGGYGLWANATWDSFVAKWQEWARQGLRLVDIDVRPTSDGNRYSGVWLPGSGGYGLWANATWDSFVAKWQEWSGQGLRLVDVDATGSGSGTRYTGVFLPGTGGYGLWANASWDGFVAKWREWARQGLRLVDVDVRREGSQNRYTGAFLPGTDAYYLWADVPWESFRARWEQLAAQGLRLVDYEFTDAANPSDPSLDAAGVPLEAGAGDTTPVGAGGAVLGDDAVLDLREGAGATAGAAGTAPATVTAGDGQGGRAGDEGAAAAGAETATADDRDEGAVGGTGGLESETAPATAGEQDGVGDVVLPDATGPGDRAGGSDGEGSHGEGSDGAGGSVPEQKRAASRRSDRSRAPA